MTDGHESSDGQPIVISPEEFSLVVKRIHKLLMDRTDRAQARKLSHPSDRATARHVEAAKDVFVFVHMMELIEYLSSEVGGLRQALTALMNADRKAGDDVPDLFSTKKTNFPN